MQFQNEYFYHIYNRGVDKREVFCGEKDYIRFLTSMREFNNIKPIGNLYQASKKPFKGQEAFKRLVEIVCYCLNPNHYHFLLRQKTEKGIALFMQKIGNGYTQYFNRRQKRNGSLFQGTFKAVPIKTDGRFLEISLYINGNYEIHGLGKARDWPWSSCRDYLGLRNGNLCDKDIIMADFSGSKEYNDLLIDYIKDKKQWKREAKMLEL